MRLTCRPVLAAAALGAAVLFALLLLTATGREAAPVLGAEPDCGDTQGSLQENFEATVTLTPDIAQPGAPFTVDISGVTANDFGSQPVDVIWDWDFTRTFILAGEGAIGASATSASFDAAVPVNATLGFHLVTVCWLMSPFETWFYQTLPFEVGSPPTPTPTPSNCIQTQALSQDLSAAQLAGQLLGGGITVSNITHTGASPAAGRFTDGCNVIGFSSGIMLSSGDISGVIGPNLEDGVSTANGTAGDPQLAQLAGFDTFDASVLEFDFVPEGSGVSFNYVFASDEYNEFVHSDFNDVFAFFVNGVNCAKVGGQPVTVNTVNNGNPFGTSPSENPQLYRNNDLEDGGGSIDTEMDGLTTVLACQASVQAGQVNHMKLAIADGSDDILDANVFLQAGSFVAVSPTTTPTPLATPPVTPSQTPSPTPTLAPSPTVTPTPTATPTQTPTPTASATSAPTPTGTATPGATPSPTPSPTVAPTPTPTATPTTPAPSPTIGDPMSATPFPTPTRTTSPVTGSTTSVTAAPSLPPSSSAAPGQSVTPAPPAPSPTVLGEARPPVSGGGAGGSSTTGIKGGKAPDIVRSLIVPGKLSSDADVIGTNALLAGMTLITILLTATVFNQTVTENSDDIEAFFGRILAPFRAVSGALNGVFNAASGNGAGFASLIAPFSILSLTALVYGFAEPGFGFNDKSLVLVSSLILGVGAVTYTYSGGQALLCNRGHGVPSGVKLFPVGLFVAVACVILSRVEDFQPGIIYGFIASFAVFGAASLDRRQMGQLVFIPGVVLLGVCILAWFLVDPFRNLAQDHQSSWLAAVPEGAAAALFVGGLEGIFFNMIPLEFMDGKKLWDWNKAAWVGMTGVTTFLFWHVLLNTHKSYFSALQETTPLSAVILIGICLCLTFSVWIFFKLRHARGDFA